MNAIKIFPHYTISEWEKWDGQWELIEGIPHAMSPLPVPRHQKIAASLLAEFVMQLKSCDKCSVYQPLDYHVTEDTILQPDMLVVCKPITKKYLDFPPSLLVEVLSPSTALKDRHTKYSIYESQGVAYYLIVSPDTDEVEVYELENKTYVLKQKGKDFTYYFSLEDCSVTIEFKEIW